MDEDSLAPHLLSENNRLSRVNLFTSMLNSLQSLLGRSNLILIDEKWFYYRKLQPHCNIGSWVGPDENRLQTPRCTTNEKKVMAIIAVSLRGEQWTMNISRRL